MSSATSKSDLEERLGRIHRIILQGGAGPVCMALVRKRANRASLVEAVEQLKLATKLLEDTIGNMPQARHGGSLATSDGERDEYHEG